MRPWSVISAIAVLASGQMESQGISNLQSLISNAQAGETILVPAGEYDGNIIIDKKLILIGLGSPVIRGTGVGSVITVKVDSCVVRGFVVERSGKMLVDEDAGILVKSDYNVIEDNVLQDVLFGVYLFGADNNRVRRNDIRGRKELELGERGSGIHLWNSYDNILDGNDIADVRDGFYIQNASRTHIERNNVRGVRYGLHYMYADSNVFLLNSFTDNVAGAAVMYSRGIRIRNNAFLRNRGFASYGILFQDCHDMIVDSNVVADNNIGLFFEASRNNVFQHNIIARNDAALQMFQNSNGNVFTENNFIDNLSPLLVVGKKTETRWNRNDRGNYWSSYDGYDIDQDGVGDVPMKIQNLFQYLEGKAPHLRLYLYSPASQAFAVAANAFPVMNINTEVDRMPLVKPVDLSKLGILTLLAPSRGNHQKTNDSVPLFAALPGLGIFVIGYLVMKRRSRQ
ncbi:MAG: nitrous oxide reductase family maturation protein NosD [Ignavibacteriales bacterium]|nr:nitrous oxide reductase family maturation protein NosD [Ignavibacteriales bacterium]